MGQLTPFSRHPIWTQYVQWKRVRYRSSQLNLPRFSGSSVSLVLSSCNATAIGQRRAILFFQKAQEFTDQPFLTQVTLAADLPYEPLEQRVGQPHRKRDSHWQSDGAILLAQHGAAQSAIQRRVFSIGC